MDIYFKLRDSVGVHSASIAMTESGVLEDRDINASTANFLYIKGATN